MMGGGGRRKGALSETEKFKIIEQLHSKVSSTLEMAKELGRDHRTVKKLAPLNAMNVLIREKFGSKHLFRIELCVRSRRK